MAHTVKQRPLYSTLGLTSTTATNAEIARAYRRRAVQCHPDRNPDGAEEFKALSEAYSVLSDPQRRAVYDATGIAGDGAAAAAEDLTQEHSAEVERQLRDFFATYADSEEEAADIVRAYGKTHGDFSRMVREELLFDNTTGELERLRGRVESLLKAGAITETARWRTSTAPAAVKRLGREMSRERKEAEAALAELNLERTSGGGGGEDMGSLQALIQQRQRGSWDALVSGLEEKYGAGGSGGQAAGGKKRRKEGETDETREEDSPRRKKPKKTQRH